MITGQKRSFNFGSNVIAWHSNFKAKSSRHESIAKNHFLNQQIEIVLPREKGIEVAKTLQWEGAFYYEIIANPSLFLQKEFREKYVLKGSVSMLTKNVPIDASNTACLLPTGELILVVNNETYERIGIAGKKYGGFGKNKRRLRQKLRKNQTRNRKLGQRYTIALDLKSTSLTDEEIARITASLNTHFPNVCMLITAINESGKPQTILFDERIVQARQRVESSCQSTTYTDIYVPQVSLLATEGTQSSTNVSDKCEKLNDMRQWLGFVSCRLESLLRQEEPDGYTSTFSGDIVMPSERETIAVLRWRGMLSTNMCTSLLDKMRSYLQEGAIEWASFTSWGFQDAPVSWVPEKTKACDNEHGVMFYGSNYYTFIMLPREEYYSIQSAGPHDTTA
uniref:Uncharacterized protein AlNc14C23G2373 n=1 Tax=Albugo laibachii Nc14 TaxID=890382 RepID=F0W674_9STRA|nr:conserved hypothetical protein [Albugo laibachii Nc14]|eukprot:CCA16616.1 conserved hypothetical protein [Albugo laibachii Nc14]